MERPWISVIIPVYNRPQLVLEALRSVLFQSYPRLECILVDDGSTDPPEDARRLFAADPRFRYLPIEHSGMPGAARNRGVEAARYDLIAFLDSDDLWLARKLELQAAEPFSVLLHSKEIWLRDTSIVSQKRHRHRRRGDVFPDALKKCTIGPSTVLIRRDVYEALGGFREDLEIAEDYELWLRLTAVCPVEYVDEPLIVKRAGHGEQLSEKYGHIELFRLKGLEDLVCSRWFEQQAPSIAAALPGAPVLTSQRAGELQRAAALELSQKCAIYAAGSRKRGKSAEAAEFEAKAARYSAEAAAGGLQ